MQEQTQEQKKTSKKNRIIEMLYIASPYTLSDIVVKDFSEEEKEEFLQLLGLK